jgi:ribulose-phosphate 3-epimerase
MTALRGVAPSILAADFARLGSQVEETLQAGASVVHVDVMDGHFVPPITMGALVVDALRPLCSEHGALLDVHLMVERPERHVADFARAGADAITVHAEATPHLHYAVKTVREAGCRAGVAINPGTPVNAVGAVSGELDLALLMTVNPGWGGQAFIPSSPDRLRALAMLLPDEVVVEVDGGIDETTAGPCARAGATLLVAGSAVFRHADPGAAVRRIAAAIDGAAD